MNGFCSRLFRITALLVVMLLLQPVLAVGQGAKLDSMTGDKMPDLQLTALKDKSALQGWWYGWLAGYSAATAGQAIVYFASDDKTLRQDMVLGAATTMLGAVGQLISPVFTGDTEYPSFREYARGEQAMSSEQAAELLKALAAREKEGRSWKTHAIAGVVNLGSGLITWLGYKRTLVDGLENFAINTVITEAQIWTQPVRAVRDYEKYCQMLQSDAYTAPEKPSGEWIFSAWPGGFALRLDF